MVIPTGKTLQLSRAPACNGQRPARMARARPGRSSAPRPCSRRPVVIRAAAAVEEVRQDLEVPPGNMGLPVIGESLESFSDPRAFHVTRFKEYGPVYKTRLLGLDVACIHDKDAIKRLLMAEGKLVTPHNFPHMRKLLGERSLLWMTGRKHQQNRRILSQAFDRKAIAYYMPSLEEVAERRLNLWAEEGHVESLRQCKDLAFDVATIVLISDMPEEVFRAFRDDYDALVRGFAWLPLPIPGTRYWKALRAHDSIKKRVAGYVEEAQQAAALGKRRAGLPSALDLMVDATDEEGNKVSKEELVDQCVLQLLAGHETTGNTMARMLQALEKHPAVLQKLKQEQEAVVAKFGDKFTPDVLDAMPYADAVIKEVMRVWPTVPQVTRKALVDLEVGGYRIPAGWHLLFMLDGSIKSIEEFKDDRTVFRPERWLDVAKDPKGYMPFGEGPHICLGMALAKAEMLVVLAKLVRDFEWHLDDVDERWLGFGGPINGLPTTFRKLSPKSTSSSPRADPALV